MFSKNIAKQPQSIEERGTVLKILNVKQVLMNKLLDFISRNQYALVGFIAHHCNEVSTKCVILDNSLQIFPRLSIRDVENQNCTIEMPGRVSFHAMVFVE